MLAKSIIDWLPALKWMWAVACVVFFVVACVSTRTAYNDARIVKQATFETIYRTQAWQTLRHEGAILVFQCVICVIRVWAITWAGPVSSAFAFDWAIDASLITAAQGIVAISSLMDLRDRHARLK
jgi:hypothetical protein